MRLAQSQLTVDDGGSTCNSITVAQYGLITLVKPNHFRINLKTVEKELQLYFLFFSLSVDLLVGIFEYFTPHDRSLRKTLEKYRQDCSYPIKPQGLAVGNPEEFRAWSAPLSNGNTLSLGNTKKAVYSPPPTSSRICMNSVAPIGRIFNSWAFCFETFRLFIEEYACATAISLTLDGTGCEVLYLLE